MREMADIARFISSISEVEKTWFEYSGKIDNLTVILVVEVNFDMNPVDGDIGRFKALERQLNDIRRSNPKLNEIQLRIVPDVARLNPPVLR
ncbi:hypothetical protein [Acidiphilium acidophilum]|uniref:hypothetical protein n=1 Tax=Acidiphilium acidophilum TaxID=76588 RepID=UPI002E8E6929|nr:hypothetical protein [Acidiphilium acidophilum]